MKSKVYKEAIRCEDGKYRLVVEIGPRPRQKWFQEHIVVYDGPFTVRLSSYEDCELPDDEAAEEELPQTD